MKTRIVIHATIHSLEFVDKVVRTLPNRADPGNPVVVKEKLGWFLVLEGSHEKLYVGMEKPEFESNKLTIILEG